MEPADTTLVIPCYNVATTLPSVLDAVDSLDPAPARVVCVDDGSTDGTADIAAAHDGVELLAHETNRGLGATLNTALAETDTPGLAKIDADIRVESDWLGTLCARMATHDAALIQGRFEEQITTRADEWRAKHPSPVFPDEPRIDEPINGSNILCRTEALRSVDGWDEQYVRAFDDIDLCLRLIDDGYRVAYTPDVVTTHLRTDTWREVLQTAWSYHYDSFNGRDDPETPTDALGRLPMLLYRGGESIASDLRHGDVDILWISLLRPFYHVMLEFERTQQGQR